MRPNDKVSTETGYFHAVMTHALGTELLDGGDYDRAREMIEQTIASAETQQLALSARHSLADLELDLRNLDAAEALYSDVLTAAREAAIGIVEIYCLAGLAAVAALRGQAALAGEFWGRFESIEKLRDDTVDVLERDRYVQIVDPVKSDPTFHRGYEAGRRAETAGIAGLVR